jgi:hypothetical protein
MEALDKGIHEVQTLANMTKQVESSFDSFIQELDQLIE